MNSKTLSVTLGLATALSLASCDRNSTAKKESTAPAVGQAQETKAASYACPMHPEVVSANQADKCPKCGMALKPKKAGDTQGAHGAAGHATEPTIKTTATTKAPLEVGKTAEVTIRLAKPDGSPVLPADLQVAHTMRIHMLINDQSLSDYHHEHPVETATPGEYTFSFTPKKPGPYRLWADLLPIATNAQEYSITDITATTKGEPISERETKMTDTVEGLKYEVVFDKAKLTAGEAAMGKLKITGPDGKIFSQLEPIMGAYAHLVGFTEDYKTIVHIHPMGVEPTKDTDRGAGTLEFHINPEQPGLMRLYAQVQIGQVSKYAQFTLQIAEPKK